MEGTLAVAAGSLNNALLGNLGPAIHMDVTLTDIIYLSIASDYEKFHGNAIPRWQCPLFNYNVLYYKANMVQKWVEEHNNKFEVLN